MSSTLLAEVVRDDAVFERLRRDWDRLAEASGQPYLATAWARAWWRHRRPEDAELRIVVVRRGARVKFEGAEASSPWPAWIARARPVPGTHLDTNSAATLAGPTLRLDGTSFGLWLDRRGRHFRRKLQVSRRAAQSCGAEVRVVDRVDGFDRGIGALLDLHRARWARTGGSDALAAGDEPMLREAGLELVSHGAVRLVLVEVGGTPIAGCLVSSAGGEAVAQLQGFDPRWARLSPGMLALVALVEDAFARGERRLDFGPGGQLYKRRLADGDEPLVWRTLVPPGPRAGLTRATLLAEHGISRTRLKLRRLPAPVRRRLRRAFSDLRRA